MHPSHVSQVDKTHNDYELMYILFPCLSLRDPSVTGGAVRAGGRRVHPGVGRKWGSYRFPRQRWTHAASQGRPRPPPYGPAGDHTHFLYSYDTAVVILLLTAV